MNYQTQHSSDGNLPNLWINIIAIKRIWNATKTLPWGQYFEANSLLTKVLRTNNCHDTYFQKIEIYGK